MKKTIGQKIKGYLISLIFPAAMWSVFALVCYVTHNYGYFQAATFKNICNAAATSTILGMCIAIPMMGGRFDFSAGITPILSGIIGVDLAINLHVGGIWVLLLCMAVAVVMCLVTNIMYILLRVPAMINSIGMVMIYEAISMLYNGGNGVRVDSAAGSDQVYYNKLVMLARQPYQYVIMVCCMLLVGVLLYKTHYGKNVWALSSNARLAINSGISQKKNILQTAVLVGVMQGCVALFTVCGSAASGYTLGTNNLSSATTMFTAMGPMLIGLFFSNYSNLPFGIMCGALGMQAMTYGLGCINGLPASLATVINGVIIVCFMAYSSNQAKVTALLKKLFGKKAKETVEV